MHTLLHHHLLLVDIHVHARRIHRLIVVSLLLLIHIVGRLLLVIAAWVVVVGIEILVLHVVLVVVVGEVGIVVLAVEHVLLLVEVAAILVDIVVETFLTKKINWLLVIRLLLKMISLFFKKEEEKW